MLAHPLSTYRFNQSVHCIHVHIHNRTDWITAPIHNHKSARIQYSQNWALNKSQRYSTLNPNMWDTMHITQLSSRMNDYKYSWEHNDENENIKHILIALTKHIYFNQNIDSIKSLLKMNSIESLFTMNSMQNLLIMNSIDRLLIINLIERLLVMNWVERWLMMAGCNLVRCLSKTQ